MGSALKHPWARGALNCSRHVITRAAGTRADPMPPPPAGDIYVHCACDVDPEGCTKLNRSIGRASAPRWTISLRERTRSGSPATGALREGRTRLMGAVTERGMSHSMRRGPSDRSFIYLGRLRTRPYRRIERSVSASASAHRTGAG